jgi:uncharacterized membrane protein
VTLTDPQIILAVALTAVFMVGVVTTSTWAYFKVCNGIQRLRKWRFDRKVTEAGRRAIARRSA